MMGTAALIGATTALYGLKKVFSTPEPLSPFYDYQDTDVSDQEIVTFPAIVSDIDGVVVRNKDCVPGTKETLIKLLTPYEETDRRVPFTFLSNGGGAFEGTKAKSLNQICGLESTSFISKMLPFSSSGPKLTANEVLLSQSILKSDHFQKRFANKLVLVDGYSSDEVALMKSYGFNQVITLKELLSLEVTASGWIGPDFYESKLSVLSARRAVCKRFNKTMDELKASLKFAAVIMSTATPRSLSFTQVVVDIIGSKDGSMHGPRRGPRDPQNVTFITTNPDFYYASAHQSPRLGPKVIEQQIATIFKTSTGHDLEIEAYGKPYTFNYDWAEQVLQKRAKNSAVKISNFYMIGDNPESDIAGAIAKGWVSILVRTGVFDPNAVTSKDGNDTRFRATHVVETFKDAIDLIYKLEKLV